MSIEGNAHCMTSSSSVSEYPFQDDCLLDICCNCCNTLRIAYMFLLCCGGDEFDESDDEEEIVGHPQQFSLQMRE